MESLKRRPGRPVGHSGAAGFSAARALPRLKTNEVLELCLEGQTLCDDELGHLVGLQQIEVGGCPPRFRRMGTVLFFRAEPILEPWVGLTESDGLGYISFMQEG